MKNLKWIEDKTNNFRGNFTNMCFKLDNSNYIFTFESYMSYKTFKPLARKVAQEFNASTIEVIEHNAQSNMTIVSGLSTGFEFRIELDVPKGARRKFRYYTPQQIFNNYIEELRTYKAEYEDDNIEVFDAENDREAIREAEKYEDEHGITFNIYLVDENYDHIKTIY
jgi:hypothetical protein